MASQESKEKMDALLKQIEEGVQGVYASDAYQFYLRTMAKFHHYSVNNQLLIAAQMPDAEQVASFNTWKQLGRTVIKGESAIWIIAPNQHKKTIEQEAMDSDGNKIKEEKEVIYTSFHRVPVFDVSQTEGKPLPELVNELTNPVDNFFDLKEILESISPVSIRFADIEGSAKGYYSPTNQEIVINRGMSEEQTLKTMLHEIAHARFGHGSEEDNLMRFQKEIQAESTAFVVAEHLGIDTSAYSFPYLASWAAGKDIKELKANLENIREQANLMMDAIDLKLVQTMELKQEKMQMLADGIELKPSMAMRM